jgi:hypothetical protein
MDQIGLVEIIGIVVVVGYIVWLVAFFQFVRPRLMARAGERMNVHVRESAGVLDSGTYEVVGSAPLAKHGALFGLDFALLFFGTVGICALVSIPGFLIAESGLPYRWESLLLNNAARIASVQVPPLAEGDAPADIRVQNESDLSLSGCQVRVADYTARNGYLNGASALFDLSPRETRQVTFGLSALQPLPGTYEIALSLECRNRLKDKIRTRVTVLP